MTAQQFSEYLENLFEDADFDGLSQRCEDFNQFVMLNCNVRAVQKARHKTIHRYVLKAVLAENELYRPVGVPNGLVNDKDINRAVTGKITKMKDHPAKNVIHDAWHLFQVIN
jgi:hypothetical protein